MAKLISWENSGDPSKWPQINAKQWCLTGHVVTRELFAISDPRSTRGVWTILCSWLLPNDPLRWFIGLSIIPFPSRVPLNRRPRGQGAAAL